MQRVPGQPEPELSEDAIGLNVLMSRLSKSVWPMARRHKTVIMNRIPVDLMIHIDEQRLAAVVGSLLNTVIEYSRDTVITISAKQYSNVMLLHIKEENRLNNPAFASSLCAVQKLAEKINGCVNVTSCRGNMTTIALSFINIPDTNTTPILRNSLMK